MSMLPYNLKYKHTNYDIFISWKTDKKGCSL